MENKKKKNGFTLIELLAIIVILAIIAVITVPIILNIIENSRQGAATDSAYGYKDSVNKWYVSKLSEDSQYQLADSYTISSDGKLGDIEIPISGNKPSGGYLNYSNNTLTGGCLVFGDYAVTFDENGNASKTEKGDCPENTQQGGSAASTVKPVIYASKDSTETKTLANIAVGDYVKLGDDGFYVIAVPQTETSGIPTYNQVVLMSEYNISEASTSTWRQDSSTDYSKPTFSGSNYWNNCIATSSEPSNCPAGSKIYRNLYANEKYGFVYDNNSNLYALMENYKEYLQTETGLTMNVRPMAYKEALDLGFSNSSVTTPAWAYNQDYWLGSGEDDYNYGCNVWSAISFDSGTFHRKSYDFYAGAGVRPVIEISTSNF